MLIDFVEVINDGNQYTVCETFINSDSIVAVRDNLQMAVLHSKGVLDKSVFHEKVTFSTISVAGGQLSNTIVVLGDKEFICDKVNGVKNVRKTK